MKKLAIIGASTGQLPLCLKAKELGLYTICFAWEKGAVCKDVVDKFYPISIIEKETILKICKKEAIDGVVSNGSDFTAEVVSYIATNMNLHGIDYSNFLIIRDKFKVRELTKKICGLSFVATYNYTKELDVEYPFILKPKTGASKKGVFFIGNGTELDYVLNNENYNNDSELIVEEYIPGVEISVETLSFEGNHFVIQLTDKENSGPPHFVELSHHQPSQIDAQTKAKVKEIIPLLLRSVGVDNGACHIEMKIHNGNVYLIEINPRGGGDEISNKLVKLSTGFDYIAAMIEVALGLFIKPILLFEKYAGIYFLCQQRAGRLRFFEESFNAPWLVERKCIISGGLNVATGNYDRNGYLIYQSEDKVLID